MLSKETRKNILKRFLRNLEHIADHEYQKRVWIKGIGPECDDFDESVNGFCDDCAIIFPYYKDYGITDQQYTQMNSKVGNLSRKRSEFKPALAMPKQLNLNKLSDGGRFEFSSC